jgi:hypothetical protein
MLLSNKMEVLLENQNENTKLEELFIYKITNALLFGSLGAFKLVMLTYVWLSSSSSTRTITPEGYRNLGIIGLILGALITYGIVTYRKYSKFQQLENNVKQTMINYNLQEVYKQLIDNRNNQINEAQNKNKLILLSFYTFLIECANTLLNKLAKPNKIKSMDDLRNKFPDVYQLIMEISNTLPSEVQSKLTTQLQQHFK